MIYTSGCRGEGKGVMIEERSLVKYIMCAKREYSDSGDDDFGLY